MDYAQEIVEISTNLMLCSLALYGGLCLTYMLFPQIFTVIMRRIFSLTTYVCFTFIAIPLAGLTIGGLAYVLNGYNSLL